MVLSFVPAHIVPLRGDGQSAVAVSAFAAQLTAQVTTAAGAPLGGAVVEFTIEDDPTGSFFLLPALVSAVPALDAYRLPDGSTDTLRLNAQAMDATGERQNPPSPATLWSFEEAPTAPPDGIDVSRSTAACGRVPRRTVSCHRWVAVSGTHWMAKVLAGGGG
ncbi:hypothetical protein [Streptomyces violaceus]|uniref:Uncharacterized protein n=1 Tax=Streptomyces violaceus TaxID=1936 RepID=A0ABY9TZU4_STRVL|nr:hypothetical protein [Streptomyces janthinus]WND15931.1 hypothetical protein RI060_00475 [Streptomyces janthinus]GGS98837.1 hypothetical protein GCM10010270_83540 [Streptomyces janthinus]